MSEAPRTFGELIAAQQTLQDGFPGTRHRDHENPSKDRCEYLKDMVVAVEDELHELLAETGWKPWTSSWHLNLDAARMEWIDALFFMVNLAISLELTEEDILKLYWEKYQINLARQQKGDTGTNKCAGCKRALDDPHTKCKPPTFVGGTSYMAWCQEQGWIK